MKDSRRHGDTAASHYQAASDTGYPSCSSDEHAARVRRTLLTMATVPYVATMAIRIGPTGAFGGRRAQVTTWQPSIVAMTMAWLAHITIATTR